MQVTYPFVALVPLRAPGTMVYGFQRGDGVPEGTVTAWELEVGVDVAPLNTGAVPRPEDDADRAQWEAYAIGQGVDAEQARAASLDELRETPEPETQDNGDQAAILPLPDPTAGPVRPDADAKKAEWVTYTKEVGADATWADDRSTTKADLMDFEPKSDAVTSEPVTTPPIGDTVAENASELQADANAKG